MFSCARRRSAYSKLGDTNYFIDREGGVKGARYFWKPVQKRTHLRSQIRRVSALSRAASGGLCACNQSSLLEIINLRTDFWRREFHSFLRGGTVESVQMPFPIHRPRRLRSTESMRRLVRETRLDPANFILPLFVCPGEGVRKPIGSMPRQLPVVDRHSGEGMPGGAEPRDRRRDSVRACRRRRMKRPRALMTTTASCSGRSAP